MQFLDSNMTFNISEVTIDNFKSFYGEHFFEFPKAPGLYYLTGKNLADPELGANGAGKSTLMDAIFWCLYGETTRGLRASDIRSWQPDGSTSVWGRFQIRDRLVGIYRSWNPNELLLDGEIATQEEIDELIGLTSEGFKYAIMFPQFGNMFFDLKPTAKLSLFTDIMELNSWLTLSDKAKTKQDVAAGALIEIDRKISQVEGSLDRTEGSIETLKESEKDFTTKQEVIIVEYRKDIRKDDRTINKKMRSLEKVKKQLASNKKKLNNSKNELDSYAELIANIEDERLDDALTITKLTEKNKYIIKAIKDMESLEGTCPTCLQNVGKKHIKGEVDKLIPNLEKDQKIIKKLSKRGVTILKEVNSLKIERSQYSTEVNKRSEKDKKYFRKKSLFENEIKASSESMKRLKNTLNMEVNKENPFTKMLNEKKIEIEKDKIRINNLKGSYEDTTVELETAKFWVDGFKKIRLYVIEETLKFLEIEVNNSLLQLGLKDWQISFDIERETKSGSVSKGFTVNILCPNRDKPVKWESWSGGETQRLRLAGAIGLSNLILSKAGIESQIEFYDEPSQHVSPEGIDSIVSTLHDRAIELPKQIWLVDHQTLDYGNFSGILKVIKTRKGKSKLKYIENQEGE